MVLDLPSATMMTVGGDLDLLVKKRELTLRFKRMSLRLTRPSV